MSALEKPSLFELNIPPELVKDLGDAEKLFKSTPIDTFASSDNTHAKCTAQIHFERIEGGVVRLCIKGERPLLGKI
jgi:hypothetical protein